MSTPAPPDKTIRLLEYEPELGSAIDHEDRERARMAAEATMLHIDCGPWAVHELCRARHCKFGLLLLDGLVSRTVVLDEIGAVELLGRGDLIPAVVDPEGGFMRGTVQWSVLDSVTIAVLDESFLAATRPWPELLVALFERVAMQSDRGSLHCAVCQLPRVVDRVHAILWLLAERWGRITPDGVVLYLRLTHEMIGQFVGAKRPTVTLALGDLESRGVVHRRADRTWVLHEPWRGAAPPVTEPDGVNGAAKRQVVVT